MPLPLSFVNVILHKDCEFQILMPFALKQALALYLLRKARL